MASPRFEVQDGEIVDLHTRQIITPDHFNMLATPEDRDALEAQLSDEGALESGPSLEGPDQSGPPARVASSASVAPTRGKGPSLKDFMAAAKEDNPRLSERELHRYWAKTYSPIDPKTLPTRDVFLEQAKADNPDRSEDELHDYWERHYGDFGAAEQAPPDKPFLSDLKEVGRQIVAGAVVDLPKMTGQAIQAFTPGGSAPHEFGKEMAANAELRAAGWAPDMEGRGSIADVFIRGGRAIAPSIATMAAYLNPAGVALGPIATIALFGGSQYQEEYNKVMDAGGTREDARNAGLITGAIQGGGEAIANKLMFGVFGAGKAAAQAGMKGVVGEATEQSVLKPWAKAVGVAMVGEPATEVTQDIGTSLTERAYGLKTPSLAETMYDSGTAAVGMTMILAPLGLVGHYKNSTRAKAIDALLANPNAGTPEERQTVVRMLHDEAKQRKIPDADQWRDEALGDVANGLPIRREAATNREVQEFQGPTEAAPLGPETPSPLGPKAQDPLGPYRPTVKDIFEAPDVDTAIARADDLVSNFDIPNQQGELPKTGVEIQKIEGPDRSRLWMEEGVQPAIEPGRAFTPRQPGEPDPRAALTAERERLIKSRPSGRTVNPEVPDAAQLLDVRGQPTQNTQEQNGFVLHGVPRSDEPGVPAFTFTDRRTAFQNERAKLLTRLPQEGKTNQETVPDVREPEVGNAPQGLQQAPVGGVAVPPVSPTPPRRTIAETTAKTTTSEQESPVVETTAAPSVQDLHALADSKGLDIETAVFRELTRLATGKSHLDDLTPQQRQTFADRLQKIPGKAPIQPAKAPKAEQETLALPTGQTATETLPVIEAAQVPRSQLVPEQNAELMARAEKAQADLEIAGTERGGRYFAETQGKGSDQEVTGLKSATAAWYKEATSGPQSLSRKRVEVAAEKILADKGRDVGKDVQRIKELLLLDREFMSSPFAPKSQEEWQALIAEATHQPVDQAAHEAAPSPRNELPEPTEAQIDAGNYKKGHLRIAGLDISIEHPSGSERSGVDPGGKPWTQTMRAHYGYIRGTKGKDKDQIDAFVAPGTPTDYSGPVFIVDQNRPDSNTFDEHKTVLGVSSAEEARDLYVANHAIAAKTLRSIKQFTMPEFKLWLQAGNKQRPAGTERPAETQPPFEAPKVAVNAETTQPIGEPFTLKAETVKPPKPKAPKPEQLGIPVPAETVGTRPIIGREVQPEEAPLFSKAAQQPDDVQTSLPEQATESPTEILANALRSAADQIERKPKRTKETVMGSLGDVGLKIGGARKDKWAERGLTLADLEGMTGGEEAKFIVKANIWKPDYAAMVQAGTDPKAAAMVKIVYDSLAAKPQKDTPEGRRQYLTMMGYVKDVLSAVRTFDDAKDAGETIRYERAGLPKRNEMRGTSQADRDLLQPKIDTFWSVVKGRSDPFYIGYSETARAAKLVAQGFPNQEAWTRRYEVTVAAQGNGITKDGAAFYAKRVFEKNDPLKDTVKSEEDLADQFKQTGVWMIAERGSGKIVGYRSDENSAKQRAQELYDTKKGGEDEGQEPVRPHLDTLTREGEDYRKGRDVTADDFKNTFGFRGVEFGNWAASDERQKHINQAFDALTDMANVLGIEPKAISLNGTLGMAFGARGIGKFAAHYEPSKMVINITKINGPGSMAHEWGHALDHYFGELDRPDAYKGAAKGASGWYTMSRYTGQSSRLSNLRPEMAQAFDRVMGALFHRQVTKAEAVRDTELNLEKIKKAIADIEKVETKPANNAHLSMLKTRESAAGRVLAKLTEEDRPEGGYGKVDTSFYKAAQTLSGTTGDYWKRPTEMFARSFESYVFDRLGRKSDYLVHGVEADKFTKEKGYKENPYPAGVDREQINGAFNHLFDTMQSKETDQGTALFEEREEMTEGEKEDLSQRLYEGLQNAPRMPDTALRMVDTTGTVSTDTLQKLAAGVHTKKLARMLEEATRQFAGHLRLRIPKFKLAAMKGFSVDYRYYGANQGGAIVYNPYIAMQDILEDIDAGRKTADDMPEFIGALLAKTMVHELTHQQIGPHGEQFRAQELANRAILGPLLSSWTTRLTSFLKGTTNERPIDAFVRDTRAIEASFEGGIPLRDRYSDDGGMRDTYLERRGPEGLGRGESDSHGSTGEGTRPPTYLSMRSGNEQRDRQTDTGLGASEAGAVERASHGLTFDELNSPDFPGIRQDSLAYAMPAMSNLDAVIRTLQDKNIDLARLVEAIKSTGQSVADDLNPVLKEEMYMGRTSQRLQDFLNQELRPLVEVMRLNKVTMAQLDEYLHARHAQEANAYLAEINPEMEDNEALSGMTDEQSAEILAAADRPKMERLAGRVDAILAKTRDLMVDYGLESPERVDQWRQQYSFYVPLHRAGFEDAMPGTGHGRSIRGSSVKTRTGSTRSVIDILANVALDREKTLVRGEKMRPTIALAALLQKFPNADIATLAKPAAITYTNEETGLIETAPGDLGAYRVPMVKGISKKTGEVEWRPDRSYQGRDNVINFRLAGKDHAIIFNEQNPRAMAMAHALKDLDVGQLNTVMSVMGRATRYLAAINTQYNPVFGVVNFVRDVQFAMLALSSTPLAGKRSAVIASTWRNLKGIYQDARAVRNGRTSDSDVSRLWQRFQRVGGPTGYRDLFRTSGDRAKAIEHMLDQEWWQKTMGGKVLTAGGTLGGAESAVLEKAGKPLFEWLSDYNQTMENAVRLGVFEAGINQGLSDEKAASLAKNITVNFNKKGQVSAQMGALYAFFNASAQGTNRLAETLFEPGKFGVLSKAGKTIIAGGVALGAMQTFLLAIAGFGDDDLPDWMKARSLIIPVPGTDKGYVSIPMPLGFNVIPNIGRYAAETLLYGRPGERSYRFLSSLVDVFSPVGGGGSLAQFMAPTATDAIVALSENKDWTGRPIYREDFDKRRPTPGFQRSRDAATPWSRGLAEAINYATGGTDYVPGKFSPTPDQIEYLISQVTGGLGRETAKTAQTLTGAVTGEDVPLYKMPLAGRFVGSSTGHAAVRDEFYRTLRSINEASEEVSGRRSHQEDTADYRKAHPEYRLSEAANRTEREVRNLTKRKRELVRQGASAEKVRLIEMHITAKMDRLNKQARQLSVR